MRDRAGAYRAAPLADLLTILLRQFRRPLKSRVVDLNDADAEALAHTLANRAETDAQGEAIRAALVELVAESEAVLAKWNLTFAESLAAEMDAIPGWETTAEFLDIANEKANAELRISTGAALLVAFGDPTYVHPLQALVARGDDDLDSIIAARVLAFADETRKT